jgi:two-component system CheB/CheR fusion protein
MLGSDLRIRRFTPEAERMLNVTPSPLGRHISEIQPKISIPDLEQQIVEVIESVSIHEREVQDPDGRWYSLRIRPFRTSDNQIEGAVICLLDIDDLKRSLDGDSRPQGA